MNNPITYPQSTKSQPHNTTQHRSTHHTPDIVQQQAGPYKIDTVHSHHVTTLPEKNTTSLAAEEGVASFFNKIKRQITGLFEKATDLIEDDISIPLSQESVNGLIERYVTKNVKYFDRLHAELHSHDFYLSADIRVKGISATISGDFEVVTFEFDDQKQHMLFRQTNETRIDRIEFKNFKTKLMTKLGLFYIRRILRRDPLAFILDYFKIATVTDNEYDFKIGRYFGKRSSIFKTLKHFQVKHAFIRDYKLYVKPSVSVSGFFDNKPLISVDDIPKEKNDVLRFER